LIVGEEEASCETLRIVRHGLTSACVHSTKRKAQPLDRSSITPDRQLLLLLLLLKLQDSHLRSEASERF